MFAEYTVKENHNSHMHIKKQLCRIGECINAESWKIKNHIFIMCLWVGRQN